MNPTVAVEDLRIGMYIHLDGGWLSHPFPLSSFRLASAEQIATVRGLGVARVRWSPEKSDATETDDGARRGVPLRSAAEAAPAPGCEPVLGIAVMGSAADAAAAAQREWLAAQREAAARCERQFGEAATAWREAHEAVASRPQDAAHSTQALTRAMLDKMLAARELGIRLVSGGADRAAAHALNVSVVSMLIGRTLGLPEQEMLDLGVGALLHDVGKQEVADRFRHAEDGFSPAELNAYRDHVAKGVALGQRMGLTTGALSVLAQHHEHVDGSGFPLKMGGERQTMAARIVAIVNRYDNLCNPGSRTLPLTPHEAVAMLFAQGRGRYDATVLNAFIRMMGVYPAGSLVQLTDDRYAMVIGVNSSRPLKPRVLVHQPSAGAARSPRRGAPSPEGGTLLVDLEQVPDLGIRRSLAASKLPREVLAALDPRPRVSYYFEALSGEPPSVEAAA